MLDAPADVLLVGVRLERRLEDVEGLAVGAIADRVDAELVAVLHRELRGFLDGRHRRRVVPGRVGLVGVGLEQPGAARAERAVDRVLDRADGEKAVCRSRSSGTWPCSAASAALPTRSMIQRRLWILPSSTIAFIRSTSANDDPASWNDVTPFDTTSFDASSRICRARARRSSAVGFSPVPVRIKREAVSRNSPVGLPPASLRKSPPAGFARLAGHA